MVAPNEQIGKLSWAIIFLALLSDTAHVRSIPSYNMAVGFWACYMGHKKPQSSDRADQAKEDIKMAAAFSSFCTITLIFDVIYCGIWAPEVCFKPLYSPQ